LIAYTDGVIEAVAPNGDFFTRNRLLSVLKRPPSSAAGLIEHIKSEMIGYCHIT
jgi:serine phosphatase RsbU (regulator of sigma subunit)